MLDMGVTLNPKAPDYLATFDPLSPEFDWGALLQSRAFEQEILDADRGIDAELERKRVRWLQSPPDWTLEWEVTLDPQAGGYDPHTDPCSLRFEPDRLVHRSVRTASARARDRAARTELDASEAQSERPRGGDWDTLDEVDEMPLPAWIDAERLLTSPTVGDSIGARVHARHAAANEV